MSAWIDLKELIISITQEAKVGKFDKMDELSIEVQKFFANKNFLDEELSEAKTLIKNLNIEIESKMSQYNAEQEKDIKSVKNIDIYKKNLEIMDYE